MKYCSNIVVRSIVLISTYNIGLANENYCSKDDNELVEGLR
jgi:hypothetical protein